MRLTIHLRAGLSTSAAASLGSAVGGCSNCGSTERISYLGFDGDPGEVKAETCERCRRYVKLFYREWRPVAEPAADDLATLALDVLVAEQGHVRNGVNLFLPA